MHRSWILPAALCLACGPQSPAPPPGVVATWSSGSLTFEDIEGRLANATGRTCRAARRLGGVDDLLPCFEELSEELALESLVLASAPDADRAIEGLEDGPRMRRQAYLTTHMSRLRQQTDVSDAEIQARFEDDPERYRPTGRLTLWNIFRRHEDPARPEATLELLAELKERYLAGETWSELARQHSQSETRLRGGLVGDVEEGRLPARLERIAFELEPGGVSDPIRVRGGAVLLHVSALSEGGEATAEGARGLIRRELLSEKMERANAALIAGRQPPPGSVILGEGDLEQVIAEGDGATTVIEIAGDSLTLDQLRRVAGLSDPGPELDDTDLDRLRRAYRRWHDQRLLGLALVESAGDDLRRQAEALFLEQARDTLVSQRLQERMATASSTDPAALEEYFEDNRPHYQSPLLFTLQVWDLPFGDDPPRQLERMEGLARRLAAGQLELAAAAAELGGTITDLEPRELDALPDTIPPKARQYLLQAEAGGYSVPYQQDEALHLIHVQAREEPRPLGYDEVEDRVRADYAKRFERELFRQVADSLLSEAGYAYYEDAVLRALTTAAEPSSGEAASSPTSAGGS